MLTPQDRVDEINHYLGWARESPDYCYSQSTLIKLREEKKYLIKTFGCNRNSKVNPIGFARPVTTQEIPMFVQEPPQRPLYNNNIMEPKQMKIIFDDKEQLTFGMVKIGQWFVDCDGDLSIKGNDDDYFTVQDSSGNIEGVWGNSLCDDAKIKRILPMIKKYEY